MRQLFMTATTILKSSYSRRRSLWQMKGMMAGVAASSRNVIKRRQRHFLRAFILASICCSGVYFNFFWTSHPPTTIDSEQSQTDLLRHNAVVVKPDANNTNWRNVQYHSGVFGQGQLSWEQERHIDSRCIQLTGYSYMNSRSNYNTSCLGPLATNTTCCYCDVSRDYEDLEYVQNYKYWSCAEARNNSLLPLNETLPVVINNRHDDGGRHQIAWITGRFGHGDYFKAQVDSFCNQVRALNFLDPQHVHCYWDSPDYVLQHPKFRRHLRYRTEPKDISAKGGGFWFHKSVILRHLLYEVYKEGDYVVYTDIDRFDFFHLGSFHAVLETMAKRGDDLSIDVMGNAMEMASTKEDVLAAFNASKQVRESPQVIANVIVIRNSPKMRQFVDAWVDCVSDWHMVSDEPSILPNAPNYQDHRHDQSILSLLIKTFMTVQAVVGQPARPFAFLCSTHTFKFMNETSPYCPFSAFNANRFMMESNKSQSRR